MECIMIQMMDRFSAEFCIAIKWNGIKSIGFDKMLCFLT